jgi:hypothetical protein
MLFELARPLDDLEEMLLEEFAGQTRTMKEIYEQHNYGRRYVDKNYKAVLTKMELEGKIKGEPSFEKRPKRDGEVTCADHVSFTFPKKRKGK